MEQTKRLTWRELRDAANGLPEELLDRNVVAWYLDREGGTQVVELMPCEEDYIYDGDEGCSPYSVLKEATDPEEWEEFEIEVVHPKGTQILVIKHPDHED